MKYNKISFLILLLFITACGVTEDEGLQTINLHTIIEGSDALTEADHETYRNGELYGTFEGDFVIDDFPFAEFVEVEAGDVIRFKVAVRNSSNTRTSSQIDDYEVGFILGTTTREAESIALSQGPTDGPICSGNLEPNTTKECDIEFKITEAVIQNAQ